MVTNSNFSGKEIIEIIKLQFFLSILSRLINNTVCFGPESTPYLGKEGSRNYLISLFT